MRSFITYLILLLIWAGSAFADNYGASWDSSVGCPVYGDTTSGGSFNMTNQNDSFNMSGTISRLSNGFAKYHINSSIFYQRRVP